ncbi:MAG: cell division protein FtsA [Pseudomonadota bacterium]
MFGLFDRSDAPPAEKSGKAPSVFAALDIGATKIACFIVKTEQTVVGPRPRVIGVAHQPSRGIRAGKVTDMDAASRAVKGAIEHAERMAKTALTEVILVTTAGAPASSRVQIEAPLSQAREVSDRDLRRALSAGLQEFFQPGRVMLHAIPVSWRVDDHRGVKDPRGMYGRELGLDLHVITAAADPLRNLATCIERCHIGVAGVVATPYASGLAVLTPDEMSLGALVVDMGANATSVGVFSEDGLVHVDSLPLGGAHVTTDIARGLSTPPGAAERIKALYGCALDSPDDDRVMIEAPPVAGETGATMSQHPRAMLNSIIRPRLEEIFELARDRLRAADMDAVSGRRMVLTGGACQLPGTAELASRVFGKQARLGRPETLNGLGDLVSGPAFSACAGAILRESQGAAEAINGAPSFAAAPGLPHAGGERGPRAVLRWFAESF